MVGKREGNQQHGRPAKIGPQAEKPVPGAQTGGMPVPGTQQASQGQMPSPGKSESATQEVMPRPGQHRGAPQGQMPARGMQQAQAQAGMPIPTTQHAASQGQMHPHGMHESGGALRFKPTDIPPGTVPPASFEPGSVEVQFREGLFPEVVAAVGEPGEIRSTAGIPLTELNSILHKHQLVAAERTLLTSHEEATRAQAVARQKGRDVPHLGHFVTLRFPPTSDTKQIAQELSKLPEVERAVPVPKAIPPFATAAKAAVVPVPAAAEAVVPVAVPAAIPAAGPWSEPLVGSSDHVVVDPNTGLENEWYIFRCRADNAWNRSSGVGVVIADVDWGCRITHQDLAPNIDVNHTYNAYDGGTDVTHGGSVFHGTGVAGLAGAAVNGVGMAGFAYGATLWPIQADSGPGPALGGNAWARGIDWIRTTDSGGKRKVAILEVQTGAFGNYEQVPSVNAAIQTAIANGVVVCVAAGNGDRDAGIDDSGNPIPETGSILVGATSYDPAQNSRAWFSNYGTRVVVCSPGDGSHDLTCDSTSDTAYRNGFGGTSGATPKVAGTAALMLAANPSLTHDQIRTILNSTGTAVVTDPAKPVGQFLKADAAVRQAQVGLAGRLEVFARGADGAVWHDWQVAPNDGWSGWASMGGWVDRLEVARNADGRLEVFARGADGAVWHNWQVAPNDGWSGWASMGGWIDLLEVGQNAA